MGNLENALCEAIRTRKVISFTYEGRTRIVEPFTLGVHKDTGNLSLCAYWIGGYSESRRSPYWRLYTLRHMQNLQVTDQSAARHRLGYNPRDSRMSSIIQAA